MNRQNVGIFDADWTAAPNELHTYFFFVLIIIRDKDDKKIKKKVHIHEMKNMELGNSLGQLKKYKKYGYYLTFSFQQR